MELIADGIHSTAEATDIAYQLIGEDRLVLITDAMRAKCLADGQYDLGGQQVTVEKQKATLEDGTIAGSTLELVNGLKHMMHVSNCTLEQAIKMGSTNAALELGIYDRKGSIKAGKDADLVLLNADNDIIMTICRGNIVYERK